MSAPLPFGPESRTGMEVELVGAPGARREELARALAAARGGSVLVGFKMLESRRPGQAPLFELAPSYRLVDGEGRWLLSLEDDFSLREDLRHDRPTRAGQFRLLCREAPVASFVERRCTSTAGLEGAFAAFLDAFDLEEGEPLEATGDPEERVLFDPIGVPVAARAAYHEDRERVAELVTPPLARDERIEVIGRWLELARGEGFAPATDGALHFHFDRDPWRDSARLRALIARWTEERTTRLDEWEPRQPGSSRGPFPDELVALVKDADDVPFADLAARVQELDVPKDLDWNVRGVTWRRPRRPTLEARFWNATTHGDQVELCLDATEDFLREIVDAVG